MKWSYGIIWMDGEEAVIITNRLMHPKSDDRNLVIYINPHGHDERYDVKLIPLENVRSYTIREIP